MATGQALAQMVIEKWHIASQDAAWLLKAVETTWQTLLPRCQHCESELAERPVELMRGLHKLPLFERCDCAGAQAERAVAQKTRLGMPGELKGDGWYVAGERTHELRDGVWRELGNADQRIAACLPLALRKATWSHFERAGQHGHGVKAAELWSRQASRSKETTWLYLTGDNGCGKSSALGCIAKDCLRAGRDVLWLDWTDLLGSSFERMDELCARAAAAEVLLLDEFGKGRLTEHTAIKAASLINKRSMALATTAIATNFALDALVAPLGNDGMAIVDRIEHRAQVCILNGINYRRRKETT
jgi:hypothetical protein